MMFTMGFGEVGSNLGRIISLIDYEACFSTLTNVYIDKQSLGVDFRT